MTKTKHKIVMFMVAAIAAASLAITGCKKAETTTGEGQKYTCEMHPEVVQDKAGKCPKCGMALTQKR